MPDLSWLFIAIILFVVFGGASWVTREISRTLDNRRMIRRHKAGILPEAVCGCGHHFSFHTAREGCHHTEPIIITNHEPIRDAENNPVPNEFGSVQVASKETVAGERTCGCKRYVGPEPITTLFSPDLATGAVEEPERPKQLRPEG